MIPWQHISTAPKDGTEILVATKMNWSDQSKEPEEPRVGNGYYIEAVWWSEDDKAWKSRIATFFRYKDDQFWKPLDYPFGD